MAIAILFFIGLGIEPEGWSLLSNGYSCFGLFLVILSIG
jgi:hypothetical protein